MNSLELHHIFCAYRERQVLQSRTVLEDLNLNLHEGELLCLLGPNGAGKTTLFRCILGLEPYRGSITVNGVDIQKLGPPELAKKIAYVPQTNYPSFNYTVFEMTLMGTAAQCREWSSPGPAQKNITLDALALAGIAPLANRGFRRLSGGEQQLCLIARAIAQGAGILVMDEPTANLDYGNQFRILKLIQSLCRQGRSIIISTHNPEHARHFADRVAALHQCRICAEGPPDTVLNAALLERLYGNCLPVSNTC